VKNCFKAPRWRDHNHYIAEDLMSPAFLAAEKSTARLPQCEQKDHENLVQTPAAERSTRSLRSSRQKVYCPSAAMRAEGP
jgi:hypothetical protein